VLAVNQVFKQAAEGDPVTVEKGETATLELMSQQSEILAQVESAGELSLALRSIAENEGKDIQDIGPVLSEKYTKKAALGNHDPLFIRYGIEAYAANP
jgi:pilus assembly protein CpaB